MSILRDKSDNLSYNMGMKTLPQALLDYEMAMLRAIADCRGVPLTTTNRREAIAVLAEALVSPAVLAITLDDLSSTEQAALQFLLDNDSRVEIHRFSRQYGVIRPMGPARLERERPWQSPANPAEGLWYRGLIFKAFEVTATGNVEVVYVPDDLAQQMTNSEFRNTHGTQSGKYPQGTMSPMANQAEAKPAPSPTPHLSLTPISWPLTPEAVLVSDVSRTRESLFNLLVYLRTMPVRMTDKGELPAKDKAGLISCLLPPLWTGFDSGLELDFLLHLGQRAELLAIKHGRLRPEREPTRAWLQQSAPEQIYSLQHVWRTDPTWNDLWHVPDLLPQPTGWENSPMLGRAKILEYLSTLTPEAWYALDDFVAAIKRIDPDFQRPSGDYDSWYIQDAQGRLLMGFENWDKIDGALIRCFLTHTLPILGVIDLGLPAETSAPAAFRLSAQSQNFVAGQPITPSPAEKMPFLRADPNFYISVPVQASLFDRFQLARFAELDRREPERVVYHITQASVGRALRNGVTADQMAAFLARVTNNRTPLKVVETLRTWGSRQDTVKFEQVTLLRLKNDALAAELRQNPALALLLGESLNSQTILIPADKVAEVRRILQELGYME